MVSAFSVFRSASCSTDIVQRDASVETFARSLERRLAAVLWQWFCEVISDEVGAIHDCCIAA